MKKYLVTKTVSGNDPITAYMPYIYILRIKTKETPYLILVSRFPTKRLLRCPLRIWRRTCYGQFCFPMVCHQETIDLSLIKGADNLRYQN